MASVSTDKNGRRSIAPIEWFTVREVAERWRVSADSVERLLKSGKLVGMKCGGWRVHASAIAEYESGALAKAREAVAKFRTVPDALGRRGAKVSSGCNR